MSAIAAEAAELPVPYLRALGPILAQAQAELTRDLRGWLENASDGDERFTAQRYRQAILALSEAISGIEQRLPGEVEGLLQAQGEAAATLSVGHLRQQILLFADYFGAAVRPVSLTRAAVLEQGRHLLISRYRNSAKRYAGNIVGDIKRMLAVGIARNETFDETTRRLVRHGGPRGLVSLSGVLGEPGSYAEYIAEGLFRRYRHWAERVVRTEGLQSYNTHQLHGLLQASQQDPGYVKRWDSTGDRRLCAICRALDGQTRPLQERFDAGRQQVMNPPAHPNCRCALTPYRPEWEADFKTGDYPRAQTIPHYKPGLDTTRNIRVADLGDLEWMGQRPEIRDKGRAESVRRGYAAGKTLPPIQVTVSPVGGKEIVDGVHRYTVARDQFPDAVIPVHFTD